LEARVTAVASRQAFDGCAILPRQLDHASVSGTVQDRSEVLAKYASTWKADPNSGHFLTGTPDKVKAVCRMFGLNFWPDEGTLAHSLHTLVIERQGKLAANFESNQFSAEQLGDFAETTLNHVR
jgi:protein SCO1/2